MMRNLYNLLIYLAMPFILLRLWWKGRKSQLYKQRWHERLGLIKPIDKINCIWIHAVSMGETIAALSIAQSIKQHFPEYTIVMTTMTPTGSEQIARQKNIEVQHYYVPYDFPGAINRFLDRIQPKLLMIMETELWPNLIHYTTKRKIPILLANARLSERSAKGYRMIAGLTKEMLHKINVIAAQSQADADRFSVLGAKVGQLQVVGNVKFDVKIPNDLIQHGKMLRTSWDIERPVWIAASTHQLEEEKVLKAYAEIRKALPNTLLILVPRHPNRFDEVANLCKEQGYQILRRSQGSPCNSTIDIFLGDSMGELFMYYAMADVAFVGGSFVPVGGHNLLEPAALKLPVISGTHLQNFVEISRLLLEAKALELAEDEQALANIVIRLLQSPDQANAMGQRGAQVVMQNRGALQKHIELLEFLLTNSKTV